MSNLKRKLKRKKLKEYYSSQKQVDSRKRIEVNSLLQEALNIEKRLKQNGNSKEKLDDKQIRKFSRRLKDIKQEIQATTEEVSFLKDFPTFQKFKNELKKSGISLDEIEEDV